MNKPTKKDLNRLREEAQTFLTDAEFNELLHQGAEEDKVYFNEGEETFFIPQIKVYGLKEEGGKRPLTLAVLPEFDENTKQKLVFGLGAKFFVEGKHHAIAAFMTTEAWTSIAGENGEIKHEKPSLDPNRQEALITAGLSLDGRTNMAMRSMNRLGKKGVISLGKATFDDFTGKSSVKTMLLNNFYAGYMIAMISKVKEGIQDEKKEKN